jgi:hypothetical protein
LPIASRNARSADEHRRSRSDRASSSAVSAAKVMTGLRALAIVWPSSTACALIPPNPNAFTTARCGPVHSRASWTGVNLVPANAECGWSTCRVGGNMLWCNARAALMSPAIPAAGMAWPIIDFTVPMPISSPSAPNALIIVSSSAASPAGVAVPWASISPGPSDLGSRLAFSQARCTARS